MTENLEPLSVATLIETTRVVETNAQLMLTELRATRQMVERATSTLALVVGLFANARDLDQGMLLHRVTQELITCAEQPEMATQLVGCGPEAIDPALLRAAAEILFGAEVTGLPTISPGVTAH